MTNSNAPNANELQCPRASNGASSLFATLNVDELCNLGGTGVGEDCLVLQAYYSRKDVLACALIGFFVKEGRELLVSMNIGAAEASQAALAGRWWEALPTRMWPLLASGICVDIDAKVARISNMLSSSQPLLNTMHTIWLVWVLMLLRS